MKQAIGGVIYDTAKAQVLAVFTQGGDWDIFSRHSETLYWTDGIYFLVRDLSIVPMTEQEAIDWYMDSFYGEEPYWRVNNGQMVRKHQQSS